ncbi:hypothetical protein A2995_00965 [Candidatus Nomurabacteria bacterium RIFCSPLOWO2_01_FULL_33_24]|uniref:Bacterial spore germination immunoglobulin-like domain-containing protein n=1 Tax=Candidatus Nomurabacteria bacterium RIFCSPLOWO2_01_FULL_33_24 TaxID=1801765 RepID=A0A1F6X2T1_9BACT|nr:MAG: hypothetical protein A2995_00965 [Candidatus Nomurabacteria bacterium RIFCSPLOWO2_01_FULL_33_24]
MQSKNNIIIILLVVLIALLAYFAFLKPKSANDNFQIPAGDTVNEKDNLEILGNKEDLVSFSISPGQEMSGVQKITGVIKGAYFFEGEMSFGIKGQTIIKTMSEPHGFATATTDWMTGDPVSFETTIDFSNFSKGPAYIEIHNDNASGLPEYNKSILIPIIIE